MKFYAYIPKPDGSEPLGTEKKLMFELKTIKGAIKRAIRILGVNCIIKSYTNFYDDKTFKIIGPWLVNWTGSDRKFLVERKIKLP